MTHPLRSRNFLFLFLSQCLSVGGSRLFQIALVWWALKALNQEGWLAQWNTPILLVATVLPPIVFLPYIGKTVEKKNPQDLILLCEAGGVLGCGLLLGLPWIMEANLVMLFWACAVSIFWFACMQAVVEPSIQKWVPKVVTESELPKALSLTSITGTVAGLVGAVLGGAVVDRFDLTGAVVVNVFSYFLSLVLINNIKLKASPNLDQNQTPMDSISHTSANSTPLEGQSTPTFWERYTQIQILDPFPTPKKLLLLFAGVNFFLTPILVFLPIFTKQVLNGSGKTLGVLEASISVGILGGSLFFYKWNFAQSILKRVSLLLLCAGVSFTSIGFFDSPLPVAMSLLMIGLCLGSLNVQIVTYFQQQIPDALKARFFALLQAFVAVAIPFGYLMVGSLAAWIQWLPFFLGAGVVLMGVISIRIYKR